MTEVLDILDGLYYLAILATCFIAGWAHRTNHYQKWPLLGMAIGFMIGRAIHILTEDL